MLKVETENRPMLLNAASNLLPHLCMFSFQTLIKMLLLKKQNTVVLSLTKMQTTNCFFFIV